MVNEDMRKRYSGYLDVDVKGRTFMRRSLDRLSLKNSVPVQRMKSSISDKSSRDDASTATVSKYGQPLSFSSSNPMYGADVDGPIEKEPGTPLARARGAKAPRGKAPRGKKAAASKAPLTTEFGSLARKDNRPIVYAVSAWCMVMPAAQAAQEVIKAKADAVRVAAKPEDDVDSLEEGSDGDDAVLAPKLKPKIGKKAEAAEPEGRARAGSFRKFFRRKSKTKKKKEKK